MFKTIMVPVDLEHAGRLARRCAPRRISPAIMARRSAMSAWRQRRPGRIAHTPEEFARKLDAFAKGQSAEHGHAATSRALTSHDPAVDLDRKLEAAVHETGADLVVMASHVPGRRRRDLALAWRPARLAHRCLGVPRALRLSPEPRAGSE